MILLKNPGKCLEALFSFFTKKTQKDSSLDKCQHKLEYRFNDISLLIQSLTHKSYVNTDDKKGALSNERLEFLGDSVLNCLVTEHLYMLYPEKSEGQLSKIKSLIVSRKILGEIALFLDLGRFLLLGLSEEKSGGQKRESILSNTFEAVIGAVYLDGGLSNTRKFLNKHLFTKINDFLKDKRNINYKSTILEMSQRDGFGIPKYSVLSEIGPEHAKQFTVEIEVAGVPMGKGLGPNKKTAQQNAAHKAIANYNKKNILSRIKGASKDELVFN